MSEVKVSFYYYYYYYYYYNHFTAPGTVSGTIWVSQYQEGTRSPAVARGGRPYCLINLILTLSPSLIDF